MKPIFHCVLFASGIFLSGCKGLSDRKLVNHYFLVATDGDKSQTALSYEVGQDQQSFVGVIDEMVYAVGFDSSYIIVKQHPSKFPSASPDREITNYYIVVMAGRDVYSEKKCIWTFWRK